MRIRILLVDDQRLVLEGVRILLQSRPELEVLGTAANGRDSVDAARKLRPDMVLMDVEMPIMNGVEATRRILRFLPDTQILGVSMYLDSRKITDMLNAGARGYVLKQYSFDELFRAIKTVHGGHVYLCPAAAGVLVETMQRRDEVVARGELLSPREREVLQLIAEGFTTKEIAGQLGLSVKTVETHRKKVMNKLQLNNTAALTKYAIREGLTSTELVSC